MTLHHDAWLVDLDGTLYQARLVKLCMLAELSLGGWGALGTLRRFRVEHELLRQMAEPLGDPWRAQLERTARALDLEPEEVEGRVREWMIERPGKWLRRFRRAALLAELEQWIAVEREHWEGRRLLASEHRFGTDGSVTIALPDGRTIAFTGSIDRIDELPDGTLLVTDHKTGSARGFSEIETDPTLGGTHFQLPVYAAAARVFTGRPDAPVRAEYAFFRKGEFKRYRTQLDDAAWKLAVTQLAEVVAGIESGLFPATPEPPGWRRWVPCDYCEPDGLGTTERFPEWDRKRHDPRLARWFGDPETEVGAGA